MYDFNSRPEKVAPTIPFLPPKPELRRTGSASTTLAAKTSEPTPQGPAPTTQAAGKQAAPGPEPSALLKALTGVATFSAGAEALVSYFITTGATSELRQKLQLVVDELTKNRRLVSQPAAQSAPLITDLHINLHPGNNEGKTVRTSASELTIDILSIDPGNSIAIASAILADELYTAYQLLVTHQLRHYKKGEQGITVMRQNDTKDWGTWGYDALDELETKIASLLTLRNIKGKDLRLDEYVLPGYRNASVKAMRMVLEVVVEMEKEPGAVISVESVRDRLVETREGGKIATAIADETPQEKKSAAAYKSIRDFASDKYGYGKDLDILYNTPQFLGGELSPNKEKAAKQQKELDSEEATKKRNNIPESFADPGTYYLMAYYRALFALAKSSGLAGMKNKEMETRYLSIAKYLKLKQATLTEDQLSELVDEEMGKVVALKMKYRFPAWDF